MAKLDSTSMPPPLRLMSAILGVVFLVLFASLAAELLKEGWSWPVGMIALYLFGAAVDLITGAIWGKWPFSVLLSLQW